MANFKARGFKVALKTDAKPEVLRESPLYQEKYLAVAWINRREHAYNPQDLMVVPTEAEEDDESILYEALQDITR